MRDLQELPNLSSGIVPTQDALHMARFSAALEFMPWGLMNVDMMSNPPAAVYANNKAEDFFGKAMADIVGVDIENILRAFGLEGSFRENLFSSRTTYLDHEIKTVSAIEWRRVHFIPYGKNYSYCLIVIEDTTEKKILEGQYVQAQRLEALGELAGGVTHDFNNILSIIDGYARMARKMSTDKDIGECLDKISQSVQRGSALTHQLLSFGRHKGNDLMPTDLASLIKDHRPLLSAILDASVRLEIEVEEGIFADAVPDYISQILFNLCLNARDAMLDGGVLSIVMTSTGEGKINLRISDTGIGMEKHVHKNLFKPFFTTKPSGKGTGLGLSMVYSFVKEMNGDITVETEVGKGTSFFINLSRSQSEHIYCDIPAFGDDVLFFEGCTALVAEDEPDLLNLLSGMLEEMGICVLRAGNGNEALLLQDQYEGAIDILLTDVVMPELNGVRLAELFGELRPSSKVMFMSGYPESGKMSRVPLPDGVTVITKPVDMNKLGIAVRGVMKGKAKAAG